jgi:hypothetical protein
LWVGLREAVDLVIPIGHDPELVHKIICCALEEGRLWDRDHTPPELWRVRFKRGGGYPTFNLEIGTGTMIVPWFAHGRWQQWPMVVEPEFLRANILTLFEVTADAVSDGTVKRPVAELAIRHWFREQKAALPPGQRPPSETDLIDAACTAFPNNIVTRKLVLDTRDEVAPEWKRLRGRPRKQPPSATE